MNTAAWTAAHVGAAPAALRERIEQLIGGMAERSDVAASLAKAASETLHAVMAGPGDRTSALDLLSADALITLALLAQAEREPARLGEVALQLLGAGAAGA